MAQHGLPNGVTSRNGRFEFDFDVVTVQDIEQMVADGILDSGEARDVITRIVEGAPSALQRFSEGAGGAIARAPSQVARGVLGFGGFQRAPGEISDLLGSLFAGDPSATAQAPSVSPASPTSGVQFPSDATRAASGLSPDQEGPILPPGVTIDQTGKAVSPQEADVQGQPQGTRGFRIENTPVQTLNRNTGQLESTFQVTWFPTIVDHNGDVIDDDTAQSIDMGNPLQQQFDFQFDKAQFDAQLARDQSEKDRDFNATQGQGGIEDQFILELLQTSRGRNLLSILQAQSEGEKFVDIGLPSEVLSMFRGSSPEQGLAVGRGNLPTNPGIQQITGGTGQAALPVPGGVAASLSQATGAVASPVPSPSTNPGVNNPLVSSPSALTAGGPGDNHNIAFRRPGGPVGDSASTSRGAPRVTGDPVEIFTQRDPRASQARGNTVRGEDSRAQQILQKAFGFLDASKSSFGAGPGLTGQLTPGTVRGFTDEEIGALEAAFINSGTTLSEQQRLARGSALPGGR